MKNIRLSIRYALALALAALGSVFLFAVGHGAYVHSKAARFLVDAQKIHVGETRATFVDELARSYGAQRVDISEIRQERTYSFLFENTQ